MVNKLLPVILAIWLGLALAPEPAHAQDGAWRVTSRSGVVRLRQPGQAARDARLNESLRPGATVTTGADSAATIENGAQRMTISANSRMTVARASSAGMTRIIQNLGTILFQVDRRHVRHFRVETPRLAAVVKGTTFTVTVNPAFERVNVSEGLVEVRANRGGALRDVAGGHSVLVADAAPGELVMDNDTSTAATTGGNTEASTPLRGQFSSTEARAVGAGASALRGVDTAASVRPAPQGGFASGGTQLNRLRSKDSANLFAFVGVYLAGSFLVGVLYFFFRRFTMPSQPARTGRRGRRPQRQQQPQQGAQTPAWLKRRPGGFAKIAGLGKKS